MPLDKYGPRRSYILLKGSVISIPIGHLVIKENLIIIFLQTVYPILTMSVSILSISCTRLYGERFQTVYFERPSIGSQSGLV